MSKTTRYTSMVGLLALTLGGSELAAVHAVTPHAQVLIESMRSRAVLEAGGIVARELWTLAAERARAAAGDLALEGARRASQLYRLALVATQGTGLCAGQTGSETGNGAEVAGLIVPGGETGDGESVADATVPGGETGNGATDAGTIEAAQECATEAARECAKSALSGCPACPLCPSRAIARSAARARASAHSEWARPARARVIIKV
ncbi:MAG TPA: hypothetical protein VGK89_14790 [Candidatus Eisenbacteria bacterium]|jgi:hypothetical protein